MNETAGDNPFWRFSLVVYAAPGVSNECLDLQDRHGLDVNVLLFVVWLGTERALMVTPGHLKQIDMAVAGWQNNIVAPVRTVRRRIKDLRQPILYEEAKALELSLERAEQSMLFAFASALDGQKVVPQKAIAANASLYAASKGAPTPMALIAAAASRF